MELREKNDCKREQALLALEQVTGVPALDAIQISGTQWLTLREEEVFPLISRKATAVPMRLFGLASPQSVAQI